MWVVRAGRGGFLAEFFREENLVGVDFLSVDFPQSPVGMSREQLTEVVRRQQPDLSKPKVANAAGQLYRFLAEINVGDDVLVYDPSRRIYSLGSILTDADWQGSAGGDVPLRRSVEWRQEVPRDSLSVSTRNTLGAIQTLFQVNETAAAEIRALAENPGGSTETAERDPADQRLAELQQETIEKAEEFIEDRINQLEPYEMQDLVAGILRGMGYKTRVAAQGPDRGVDIAASPDGLMLEEPRIFVEVKHRPRTAMGSPELRSFLGGRTVGDRCLYVSTGGFTKEARYEAERSTVSLTLIDLPKLRELLVEHYESLDLETTQLVPLKRIYWPIDASS